MLDPNLAVQTVITGLSQPTSMAFVDNGFFVLEKNTGKVQYVVNGAVASTAIDLATNSASERGLLGIALHPNFTTNHFVYLYWTESSTGADSTNLADVPVLGNRVDRYVWNGSTLTFDRNLIKLRAYQADPNQPLRGNHNGGILRFGPDGKLYILMGDNGRRGFLQNNQLGPVPDDQFGGPEPDDAHLTGFILRLNDDGTTPSDNPFFNVSTSLTGEAAANIKKLYAYGVRNGFGLAFDPLSGNLWDQENGDDAYDEMNRITPGANNGWVATMGPVSRVADYKAIETTYGAGNLQQLRWPPSLIADTPAAALAQLYMSPGAHYNDPEFSWKYALAPAGIGFVQGTGIGPQYEGDMFVAASRTFLSGGFLFRFKLTPDRLHYSFTDSRLNDLVADNTDKFDITESESLLIGKDFGIATDVQTGPNGHVYVVSNSNGAVYEISGAQPTLFFANLTGAQEVPANNSTATGTATLLLSPDHTSARVALNFSGLTTPESVAHIHGPGAPGTNAPVLFPLPQGEFSDFLISLSPGDVQDLQNGLLYINVHSSTFPNGEIRGQFQSSAAASSVQFSSSTLLVTEGAGSAVVKVTRSGNTSLPATVNYQTSDTASVNCAAVNTGLASSRCDYETVSGKLQFAAGETSKTISIPLVDDAYAEGNENFAITLASVTGADVYLGSPATTTITITDNESVNGTNPIDKTAFFIRQHYLDFLNREPDTPGFVFWTNQIDSCGADPQCIEIKRINVSAAFFLSIEFQETGYLVYRTYKSAYGNLPNAPVPLKFEEFLPDTQQMGKGIIVGQTGWEALLENNKVAFMQDFVTRTRFTTAYPTTMTPAQFVDALYLNAGVTPSAAERTSVIGEFGSATNTADTAARARALRRVAENAALIQQEKNRAFVLMEYFGYLRRNPNDPPEINLDFSGYNFWLTKLNQFNGNFVNAEMVKAFIISGEYRQRFGPN
jgi:glucose/arabinose dehydrogenase